MRLVDLPRPDPAADEVLIRTRAVGLNGSDWEITTGYPLYSRIFGTFRPRISTLGSDVAGVVEAVGPDVTKFKTGDRVFGDLFERWGGFAEFLTAPEDKLLPIPEDMDFVTAAAIPQSGTNALQPMRDASVSADGKVLIIGACGSAGPYAIQLAKLAGADVTAVDKGQKLGLATELGADHTVDYQTEDVTKRQGRYDLVLDYFATRSFFAYRRILAPTGSYYFFGGSVRALVLLLTLGRLFSRPDGQTIKLEAVTQSVEKQAEIATLLSSGKLRTAIGATYPFEQIPDALEKLRAGTAQGKLVILFPETGDA